MLAARWHGVKDIRLDNIPEPEVKDGMVKVKVKWCGICGSDLHEYLAGPIFVPVGKPHPLTGEVAPVVLGHEYSGEVVEVGKGVGKVKPGDRVVVEPMIVCGKCPACKAGRYNLCSSLGAQGLSGGGGGFAEYTTAPERFIHKIPDNLSFEKGALVEPMSVAYHSLEAGNFTAGQSAVVTGAGPIGLATVECLKALGASKIIMVQRKSVRQKYAADSGADIVLDPNEVDAAAEIMKLTGGTGADIAFETTGAEQCFNAALAGIRAGGCLVVTSIWEKPVSFELNAMVVPEKKITGIFGYCNDFPKVIDLLASGRVPAKGYITKKIYLGDIVKDGFGTLTGPDKKAQVKIIVTPDKRLA